MKDGVLSLKLKKDQPKKINSFNERFGLIMRFTVQDLKDIAACVRVCTELRGQLTRRLRRRQPFLCERIDEVGFDPRCKEAADFCMYFCGLALEHAEILENQRFPAFPIDVIHVIACHIVQRRKSQLGKRACAYSVRIRRHVLAYEKFDKDDSAWLRTTISTFLFLIEELLRKIRKTGRSIVYESDQLNTTIRSRV